jgi:FkbM family methyltransferase
MLNVNQLLNSKRFLKHYTANNTYARFIINQINNGLYKSDVKDKVILDIGANVGLVSIAMAQEAKKVYSVEPTPDHVLVFRELIETLKCNNIDLEQAGIFSETKSVPFFTCAENSTMNSAYATAGVAAPSFMVQMYTLGDFMALKNIDVVDILKLDAEGCEFDVLSGLTKELAPRIRQIYVEPHNAFKNEHHGQLNLDKKIAGMLTEVGYVCSIDKDGVTGTYQGN